MFDPQMTVINVKCDDVIKINHIFGPFIDIVHKNKLHHWIPEMKLNQKSVLFSKILILKMDHFWTLFGLTFRSNLKITATIGFYV